MFIKCKKIFLTLKLLLNGLYFLLLQWSRVSLRKTSLLYKVEQDAACFEAVCYAVQVLLLCVKLDFCFFIKVLQ